MRIFHLRYLDNVAQYKTKQNKTKQNKNTWIGNQGELCASYGSHHFLKHNDSLLVFLILSFFLYIK